jgi:hypothetical protein
MTFHGYLLSLHKNQAYIVQGQDCYGNLRHWGPVLWHPYSSLLQTKVDFYPHLAALEPSQNLLLLPRIDGT